jgi:hypothetical protein
MITEFMATLNSKGGGMKPLTKERMELFKKRIGIKVLTETRSTFQL